MLINYIMTYLFATVDSGVYIRGMRHEYLTPVTCKKIYRLTRHICRTDYGIGDEDAADISQALLLDLFRKRAWERYPIKFESLSWAPKWVHFAVRRWTRDQERQWHVASHPLFSIVEPQRSISKLDYEQELRKIPSTSVPILQLKLHGYSDSEIKGVTGMSAWTYDQELSKLRAALRTQYSPRGDRRAYTGKQPECSTLYAPSLWHA